MAKSVFRIFFRHWYPQKWSRLVEECPVRIPDRVKYATRARAVNSETGEILGEEWSFCCERDQPQRKRGRDIAAGRLMKRLQMEGIL